MAFRFALENVLKHRGRLEELAQKEFAEAQAAVNEVLQAIDAMYRRSDEVREEIADSQKHASTEAIEQIRGMETFLVGQKIRIETLRLRARELMMIAEEKQEALIAAAKEKKVLVKLKEKRQREHREWLNQVEAKELDDMTSVRHARRKV